MEDAGIIFRDSFEGNTECFVLLRPVQPDQVCPAFFMVELIELCFQFTDFSFAPYSEAV